MASSTATEFHRRTGSLVSLSNSNRTANRNHPAQEFNNGIVLSLHPLRDNQLFEVRIDKKVNSWSGSIEIGVTSCDPMNLSFPTSATGFHEGTWVMSGCSIMKDGHTTLDEYGQDLDQLAEGDRVGVMRTSNGVLHIYVNGVDQGAAATNIPSKVWAVVDMYGKCAQVTIVDDTNREVAAISNELVSESMALASNELTNDKLVFHDRHGTLIKLSSNRRVAERRRPLDEFNNGVVMTNRPLRDNELFEIRLERLVDKWSGSIEVGITTHNPNILDFPATMTNMRSGTIMMSGSGILTNGKGTRRQYGDFNLDELQEGDKIGLIRKANGTLHYYINDIDQGVAATKVPQTVWGVVDLYGMAVKVTVLEGLSQSSQDDNLVNRMTSLFRHPRTFDSEIAHGENVISSSIDRLLFHTRCGIHATVINNQRTAHRPNAFDDFNNAVVVTQRVLRPGEMFEVVIDKMVDKWAGSIEIGVTTHSPVELEFPSTMTNVRSGTWMMTGNGVMRNGTTILEEYGQNLDRLKGGDHVGVLRKDDGVLHFFVNGIDQGPAASNVPANIYGVIDLYGQAAQATIVDPTTDFGNLGLSDIDFGSDELRFHPRHGQNAVISADGKTASRPSARGEFNDAIVMSNRPLADHELFEVCIDKMVERWSGSIEAGVTLVSPEDIDFPSTMTDIAFDTWLLSGSSVMQDGSTIRNGYRLDLDSLRVGSRVGMMRCSDETLHYYLDGVDQGVACSDVPPGLYAVIDLYGQCAQVTITSGQQDSISHANNVILTEPEPTLVSPSCSEMTHRFSRCAGKNIEIRNGGTTACRVRSYDQALIFSCDPIKVEEIFEVRVDSISNKWAGSLQVGLTTLAISDSTSFAILPSQATDLKAKTTWVVTGSEVRKNGVVVKENYGPSLDRLCLSSRIGVKRSADGNMHLLINGEDVGVAANNIPKNVFAIVDLYGRIDAVSITSNISADLIGSSVVTSVAIPLETTAEVQLLSDEELRFTSEFHDNRGKNIGCKNDSQTAERISSYNQGLVFSAKPLPQNHLFQVKIDRINTKWTASLVIGVVGFSPEKWTPPSSALNIKKPSWLFHADSVYDCGKKVKENCGINLDALTVGQTVGVKIDQYSMLHLVIDGEDRGAVFRDLPSICYAVVDLYGQCEQVTLVSLDRDVAADFPIPSTEDREKADKEDGQKEKLIVRQSDPNPTVLPNCEILNVCSRFKAMLGLPEAFFTSEEASSCYCENCSKIRGDNLYSRKGEPPKDYALPFGWCKFNLRMPLKTDGQGVHDKWHIGFHGTKPGFIRRLLDSGDLLTSSKSLVGGVTSRPLSGHFDEKNKPEELLDIHPIVLSPTLRYAGCQAFAPAIEFRDQKTRKLYHVRVALQVFIKPGSYKIGPQSTGTHDQFDPKFSNNEVEWSTKERGATTLCALLIKAE